MLGPATLLRRLLSRSLCALRHHHTAEPPLLRMDPRLDRYLSAHLRRACRTQSQIPRAIRSRGFMKHLRTINRKAELLEQSLESRAPGGSQAAGAGDVVALQQGPPQQPPGPHFPLGCSLQFDPGWETDSNGGTAGLCQPVERDLFDCHTGCYWPAQVPD